ncbi:MAG: type II toxin-antitoxin system HicB family antitoxin [Armatimonadetes bacterium]|nr:type II toxin-antitoxin system HicB family antitoxin [Armatimonadota bacterium]
MIDYKGYTGVFEFDPDLRLFTGHVVDLRDEIYFEGDSVEAIEASMRRAVDHYLGVCATRGEEPERPFSGKLNVRLGSELHRAAAVAAAARGESLNAWLARIVEEAARTPGDARMSTVPTPRRRRMTAGKTAKRAK